MTKDDLTTTYQRKKVQREKKITQEYKRLRRDNPEYKPYRLISALSSKHQLSISTIRTILIKAGEYKTSETTN